MALSKSYCFRPTEQLLARYGQVLSHPARVRILYRLMRQGPSLFAELAQAIPLSEPTVSNHLRLLERAGLIQKTEVYFGETGYTLNVVAYAEACRLWRKIAEEGLAYCAARETD